MWMWLLGQNMESIYTFISYCYLSSPLKGPLMLCGLSLEMNWIANRILEAWEKKRKKVNKYKWFAAVFYIASQWWLNISSIHMPPLLFYLKKLLQWNICSLAMLQNMMHRSLHYLNVWTRKCSMHFLPPIIIFILQ